MSDPIRDLEEFGSVHVAPLPPAEIRRLGDRRRTRRRSAAVVTASILAGIAVAVPVALTHGGESADGTENIATTTPSPTPDAGPSSSPSPTENVTRPPGDIGRDITFPGNGIEVRSAADAAKLVGTSETFQQFIGAQAELAARNGQSCPDATHGVLVKKYSPLNYAIGAVNDCGGYQALWATHEGDWELGMGTQDAWDCDILRYYAIPRSFVGGECFNESGGFGPESVSEVTLGMSQAEVVAAGGRITPSPGGEACPGLVLPYQEESSMRTDGEFLSTRGVMSINARPGMKTPERVGLGTSLEALRTAYPGVAEVPGEPGSWRLALGPDREYRFLVQDDTVTQLALRMPDAGCSGG